MLRSCQAHLFKNLVGGSTPPPLQKGGQVPTMLQCFFVAGFILFQVGPTPSRCFQFPPGSCGFPHEKINRCLTDINQCLTDIFKFNRYLTDTENQFYKISVISVKYRLSIGLYRLYRLNIGLLRFLP